MYQMPDFDSVEFRKKQRNANQKMEYILHELQALEQNPKLLLHSCCAPCSSHVISVLSDIFYITVLYYNPNIEPREEYEKRKKEQIRFLSEYPAKYPVDTMDCDYDNDLFHKRVKGLEQEKEGGKRCVLCYEQRMRKTAMLAREKGYEFFATTLSVSPYKNAAKLNEIGMALSKEVGCNYLISDFKKKNGYRHSIELSAEYHLYRQDYCGCIYSMRESRCARCKKQQEQAEKCWQIPESSS